MFGVFGCASFVIGDGFFSATYVRHNLSLHTCIFWSTYLYLLFMMLRPFIDCGTTFHGTSSLGKHFPVSSRQQFKIASLFFSCVASRIP